MQFLMHLAAEYGVAFVFGVVLLEQLGLPLPAYPVLMLTGGLAARGDLSPVGLYAAAIIACLIADVAWYQAGQSFGRRVLRLLCRISLSPDSCVRQTETIFTRWGATSLLVAKFVPGFASVATALAGALGIRRASFLVFDTLGAAIWTGVGLLLGMLFSDAIGELMQTLTQLGRWGLGLILLALLLFVLSKWWQRYRFNRQLRMDRLSVADLAALLENGERPLIVDARSAFGRDEGRIPGAVPYATTGTWPEALGSHPRDGLIVVYCACPNDATAVTTARKLLEQGYKRVRPLAGGIDAWVAAGGALER
ncbi:MAG: VTT domain-containing protein [Proteobacteria bacterium]|nr:VTT domain-containing protein [Pseudomonadota bacterium]